uniref:TNF superfamily member 8 n=1 Tax=Chelonoidis abingdonii TaxID=106734 RepID=A0A8C0IW39_CHEAB
MKKTLFQVNDSHEAAMTMTEASVSRRLNASNKTYFYFTTASLTVCLVFALATIMVLIVQRKVSHSPANCSLSARITGGLSTEGMCILRELTSCRFIQSHSLPRHTQMSKPINSPKLKWTNNRILQNITYNSKGDPVIHTPGLYLVYCNLHFHLTNFSSNTILLKMELLVNNITNRQTLFTPCSSTNRQTKFKIFQELSILHLVNLDADDWLSVKTEHYEYLDLDFLPKDNVLAVLRYSDKSEECTDCFL